MSRWLSPDTPTFEQAKTSHLFKNATLTNRELTFTLEDNTTTPAVELPKDYYTNVTFDTNLKRISLFKPDDSSTPSSFVDLPITDAPEISPFQDLKWVDTYSNPMIRASIFAQIPSKNSGNIATSSTSSNITLNDGLAVTGNNSFTTKEFQLDSIEIYLLIRFVWRHAKSPHFYRGRLRLLPFLRRYV